jgi:dUTP pyrophosphatase
MKKQVVKVFNKGTNDLPNYSTEFAAGFDIRADLSRINQLSDLMGNDSLSLTIKEDGEKIITLFPKGGRVLIPTGLHVSIPDNYELQIRPRSGLALKNGITIANSPGTLDSDYYGELGLIIINTDPNKLFEIRQGDRLAQGVLNQVEQIIWEKTNSIEELGESDRGQGGFGHTGIK